MEKNDNTGTPTLSQLAPYMSEDIMRRALEGTPSEDTVRELLTECEKEYLLSGHTFPKKPDARGYYRTYVKDKKAKGGRRQLRARDLETLREKVYRYIKGLPDLNSLVTFQDAFKYAQEFDRENVSSGRRASRNNTISKRECDYKRFFAGGEFELLPIKDINVRRLDTEIRMVLKKHEMSRKGMESLRCIINLTFKRAAFMGWSDDNPAARIIWSDYRMLLNEPPLIRDRAFSREELERMKEYIRKHEKEQPSYIPAYALEFQMITGARRGEVSPLLWDDVDMEEGTIFFHREKISQRSKRPEEEYICDYTKNGSSRYYPIADREKDFLERLKEVHEHYYPESPYLFPAENTKYGCISNNVVYQFFSRMCTKLGIPVSRAYMRGTHAFRRNAITEVVNQSNGNCVLTAQVFGNSPETIQKHYYVGENLEEMRKILNMRQ